MPLDSFLIFCLLLNISPFNYGIKFCGNSSVVERYLAKVDVAGPTPVSRFWRLSEVKLGQPFFIYPLTNMSNFGIFD